MVKIFVVHVEEIEGDNLDLDTKPDSVFIEEAERQGRVYTLEQFEAKFNTDSSFLDNDLMFLRIFTEETVYKRI